MTIDYFEVAKELISYRDLFDKPEQIGEFEMFMHNDEVGSWKDYIENKLEEFYQQAINKLNNILSFRVEVSAQILAHALFDDCEEADKLWQSIGLNECHMWAVLGQTKRFKKDAIEWMNEYIIQDRRYEG